jgi:prepilin-type N-terminal cleavage/methylation domain-containing protein
MKIIKQISKNGFPHLSYVISHLLALPNAGSFRKGFTLIELLVVFTIVGILTSVGIASYASYNNNQSVRNAKSDVLNMLSTAKSRAISQAKPPQCGTTSLTGYRVNFATPQYSLVALCGGTTYVLSTQDLPSGVTFAASSASSVTFAVSRGTSTQNAVTLTGFGKTSTINISSTGNIMSN